MARFTTRSVWLVLFFAGRPSHIRATDPSTISASSLANLYQLFTSSTLSFPSTTLSQPSTVSYVQSSWLLANNLVESGQTDMLFVESPNYAVGMKRDERALNDEEASSASTSSRKTSTTTKSTSTVNAKALSATTTTTMTGTTSLPTPAVLQITYPANSYSHQTGGAEFYSLPFGSTTQYTTMLLTYEVAFPPNFNWVQGGKLPGLRGGPDRVGCSGGAQPDGSDCFSVRLMWRPGGAGEVYAYIPTTPAFCSQSEIICNSDYGVSIQRGAFHFSPNTWQTISLLVQLNDPSAANGLVELYVNNHLAISQPGLVFRTNESIASIGGMFFSTFFGGSDPSWATPTQQYTYYRNVELRAGTPSNNNGNGGTSVIGSTWLELVALLTTIVLGIFMF
ncbi:hypothetical protein DACRYDRAFT_20755 [Dacryopinax primogenitus]|uniref:Polysaccharide lyase 14 domain-containing protein n=1 Tax=Dacryopinax primogenitus (strain DJM 731) TaxID=1858805 RepID=M5GCY5_DACPD|nr:uncharacterized protein DACRYDRAFT_20755 [Dacryopinax primogenitus]EJU04127.1 hypothetical protein DACRYDRAFT_20755 [Dacryopinax primogenitus]